MSQNIFQSTAPGKKHKSTTFDLSHDVKLTCDIGRLIPCICEPILPGDRWRMREEIFLRFNALIAPVMHEIDCSFHAFFIPTRLAYEDTEEFYTGGVDGTAAPVKTRFKLTPAVYNALSMEDKKRYFGLGSLVDLLGQVPIVDQDGNQFERIVEEIVYDAEPFMAFYLVWYHFYRDNNLDIGLCMDDFEVTEDQIKELVKGLPSGIIEWSKDNYICRLLFTDKYRAWEKDYFTSALPWAQRGPELMIPGIGGTSGGTSSYSIEAVEGADPIRGSVGGVTLEHPLLSPLPDGNNHMELYQLSDGHIGTWNGNTIFSPLDQISGTSDGYADINPNDIAQVLRVVQNDINALEEANSDFGTINNLRRMLAIQKFSEAEARGGSRYPEWLQQIWGTNPGDYRLQRPSYLGGKRTKVVVSEVLQQSATAATPDGAVSPLGDYAGRATTAGSSRLIGGNFREYGILIGIMSLRPRSGYMQGQTRKFGKYDKYDYGNPYFANLGEQEVKGKELFYTFALNNNPAEANARNESIFGYQSRYAEYKYSPNRVHGGMRGTLDFWHLTRKFTALPGLNRKFVYITPSQNDRIFAVTDESEGGRLDNIVGEIYFHIKAKRRLPRYGIPK